jgi:hypothetical protein
MDYALLQLPAYVVEMTHEGGVLPYVINISEGPHDGQSVFVIEWTRHDAQHTLRCLRQRLNRDPGRASSIQHISLLVVRDVAKWMQVRDFAHQAGVIGFLTKIRLDEDGEIIAMLVPWSNVVRLPGKAGLN